MSLRPLRVHPDESPSVEAPLSWPRVLPALCLGLIVVAGAVLRFATVTQRGLILWDEAKFALEGIRVEQVFSALLGLPANPILGKPIGSAKPTHALLVGIAYRVLGVHDYAPLLMNALASTLEIPLVFWIGRRMFGTDTALLAALLLAVSEYDILYARSALSENDAALLLLVGFALWLGPFRDGQWRPSGRLLPAAIVLGLAFTTNYRLIVYVGALGLLDIARTAIRSDMKHAAGRIVVWAAGLLIAPCLWEIIDLWARWRGFVLFQGDLVPGQHDYLGQIFYQLHEGKQSVLRFQPLLYVQWYAARQGWLAFGLLLMGIGMTAWRRTFPWIAPAVMVLLPYAVYVFAPFVVPRNLVAALPFAALVAGAATVTLAKSLNGRGALVVLTALAALVALFGSIIAWPVTAERSGFARAVSYVDARGGRALTTSEVPVFYLRGNGPHCFAPALSVTLRDLGAARGAGYRLAILDAHHDSYVSRWIRAHARLVAHIPALGPVHLADNPISSENSSAPGQFGAEYVDIYSLNGLRLPRGGQFIPCKRDHIQ